MGRGMNRWAMAGLMILGTCAGLAGCSQVAPDREARMARGYVYYVDGAGGGGALMNWAGGVRQGLVDAGYDGAGEMFRWETGLGVLADQTAGEPYKRKKAAELAAEIREYAAAHPGAPVTLMGLSAGTVIVAFALEALPEDVQVDQVVLLSGSLSAGHDLTKALRHVRGKMYVFTSEKDGVLAFLVPIAGTADRAAGTVDSIGRCGPRRPANLTPESRRQYAKIVEVPWNEQFRAYGHGGAHTDSVKARFVEAVVAPLVLARPARFAATEAEKAGQVANPDFARWADFAVGSWVEFEGTQEIDGVREPLRMRATLVTKDRERLIVDRVFEPQGAARNQPPLGRRFYVSAMIAPEEHPLTHPQASIGDLPARTITLDGRPIECPCRQVRAAGTFPQWGTDPVAKVCSHPDIPGGMATVELRARMGGRTVAFSGRVVARHVAAR